MLQPEDYKMTRIIIIIIGRVILVSQSWHEIEKSTVQMASLEKVLYVPFCAVLNFLALKHAFIIKVYKGKD